MKPLPLSSYVSTTFLQCPYKLAKWHSGCAERRDAMHFGRESRKNLVSSVWQWGVRRLLSWHARTAEPRVRLVVAHPPHPHSLTFLTSSHSRFFFHSANFSVLHHPHLPHPAIVLCVMCVNDHDMPFKCEVMWAGDWFTLKEEPVEEPGGGGGCGGGERKRELRGPSVFILLSRVLGWRARRMERMESMEPISAHYTTAYPEIHPDSGYESRETTDSQAKTPPAPTYDEELVHKVGLLHLTASRSSRSRTWFFSVPHILNFAKLVSVSCKTKNRACFFLVFLFFPLCIKMFINPEYRGPPVLRPRAPHVVRSPWCWSPLGRCLSWPVSRPICPKHIIPPSVNTWVSCSSLRQAFCLRGGWGLKEKWLSAKWHWIPSVIRLQVRQTGFISVYYPWTLVNLLCILIC